uniref:Uncharacterized protein n=1 Tax=Heterorhabditis bacteriophora TaxID=37862 RepID=A0A1I7XS13_HETBA
MFHADDSTSESASGSFTPLPDTYVSCNINSSPEKQTQLVASNISSFARCDPLIKSSKIPKIHSTIFPTEEDRSLRNEILLKKNTKDVQDKYNTFGKLNIYCSFKEYYKRNHYRMKNISNEYLANRKSLEQAADKRIRTEELGESSESICKRTQVHIPNSYFNVRAVNLGGKAQAKAAEINVMSGATDAKQGIPLSELGMEQLSVKSLRNYCSIKFIILMLSDFYILMNCNFFLQIETIEKIIVDKKRTRNIISENLQTKIQAQLSQLPTDVVK